MDESAFQAQVLSGVAAADAHARVEEEVSTFRECDSSAPEAPTSDIGERIERAATGSSTPRRTSNVGSTSRRSGCSTWPLTTWGTELRRSEKLSRSPRRQRDGRDEEASGGTYRRTGVRHSRRSGRSLTAHLLDDRERGQCAPLRGSRLPARVRTVLLPQRTLHRLRPVREDARKRTLWRYFRCYGSAESTAQPGQRWALIIHVAPTSRGFRLLRVAQVDCTETSSPSNCPDGS